jgi:DNA-binding response OmpR family regulator
MKKIIVAEDDQDILFILDMILNDAGYQVEAFSDGVAIMAGHSEVPDLFILDKDMPSIDGLSLCKHLRSQRDTKDTPIIMISAFHYLRRTAKHAGVNEFIEKPFEVKLLLNTIRKYIDYQN